MGKLVGVMESDKEVIALAEKLILKNWELERLTLDDVTQPLQCAVEMWCYGLPFQNFEFLDDICRRVRRQHDQQRKPFGQCLTRAQAKGAANCWRAHLIRNKKQKSKNTKKGQQKAGGPDLSTITKFGGRGRAWFAVEDPQAGKLRYFRIDKATGRWDGWYFVKEQLGPNYKKVGAQKPDSSSYNGEYTDLIAKIATDPDQAALVYGQTVGRCCRCNLELTDPTSREMGIGPDCRKKAS